MCGILGVLGRAVLDPVLLGLERLDYRGYDSSGVAFLAGGTLHRYRHLGPAKDLREKIPPLETMEIFAAIGHTRWATHGKITIANAHPHSSEGFSLVHNGTIDNFLSLKQSLQGKGYTFHSETDTEVAVHLLHHYYGLTGSIEASINSLLEDLKGNFSMVFLQEASPNQLWALRKGIPPLILGYTPGKTWGVSSDNLGLLGIADKIQVLPTDHYAVLTKDDGIRVFQKGGTSPIEQAYEPYPEREFSTSKGGFEHYMLKEIYEQPVKIHHLMRRTAIYPPSSPFGNSTPVTLLGSGTSFYAAWAAKSYLGRRYPVNLALASEFHWDRPKMTPGTTLALSQSGETADTLRGLDYAKSQGQSLLAVVNTPHSAMERICGHTVMLNMGTEIGVASTKSFSGQLWMLLHMGGFRQDSLLPSLLERTLDHAPYIQKQAEERATATSMLYMGRSMHYALAMEAALKLKELAYIHGEGLALGELKHGPLAFIDACIPLIIMAPYTSHFEKTLSNLHEIKARNGAMWILTDVKGAPHLGDMGEVFILPSLWDEATILSFKDHEERDECHEVLSTFVFAVALQLFAYYTAKHRNCSIDRPRNLAKSVTVE